MTRSDPPAAWALHTALDLDAVNLHLPALEAAGLLGMAEEHGETTIFLARRVDVGVEGRWRPVAERDWNAFWKAGIEPVTVGEVTIVPPWLEATGGTGIVLVIEPAQAFGTGHHATTSRCLQALQEEELEGRSLLDVGTGTGVLALAADRLGARRVVAVDTDPLAVEAATRNATLNGCAVDVRAGSLDAAGGETFDVVVANLDTNTLKALAGELGAHLAPDGVLVLSGVSSGRVSEVVGALDPLRLHTEVRAGGEWAVLLARRADAAR